MLCGLVILLVATLLLCFSKNIAMLIAGRVFQGVSAALTWTVGLALVIDTVHPEQVGQALGYISVAMSVGVLVAPLIGGALYAACGYYAVFGVCFAIIGVDIFMRLMILELKERRKWFPIEEESASRTISITTQSSIVVTELKDDIITRQSRVRRSAAARRWLSRLLPPALKHREDIHQRSHSSIPAMFRILCNVRLLAALFGAFIFSSIETCFDAVLPLFVQEAFHWGPFAAGLVFLPLAAPAFLGPLIGAGSDRWGPKWFATGGFTLAIPCLVFLGLIHRDSIEHKAALCALLTGVGIAIAAVFTPLLAEVTWSTRSSGIVESGNEPLALAYACFNMAWSAGAVAGPLVGGKIRKEQSGWPTLCWLLASLAGIAMITQAVWVGGLLKWKGKWFARRRPT